MTARRIRPAVGAGAGHDVVGAAVAILAAHGIGPAADTALEKAREQVAGPVGTVQPVGESSLCGLNDGRVLLRDLALAVLDRLPEIVVDDTKLGDLRDDPVLRRVDPRDPLARLRVLDVAKPVPHQPADVELVVDQARAPLRMAPDGGIGPELARGAGYAFPVQPPGDRPRARAGGELPVHPAHDFGLRFVDGPPAPYRIARSVERLHHVVAVAEPAARAALLDPAAQPPVRLGREVLQEQRVHRPLEPDMELVDFAFRQGDDHHAGKP